MRWRSRRELPEIVERCLRRAALWDEVKDRLHEPRHSASRAASSSASASPARSPTSPTVLLMDEPCSALDPIATQRVEELIFELKQDYTIVIVTHNMQQAARVADRTGFFDAGRLVEIGATQQIFTDAAARADRGVHHREIRMSAEPSGTSTRSCADVKARLLDHVRRGRRPRWASRSRRCSSATRRRPSG